MHAHGVLCRVKDGVHNFLLRKEWKILAPRHKVNRSGKRETKGETMHQSTAKRLISIMTAFCMSFGTMAVVSTALPAAAASSVQVLTVGTFHGKKGTYTSIQAAVNAAKPGAWILIAPGDYKDSADLSNPPASFDHGDFGGVLITTSNLHLVGMNRNTVIVDGTKPGSPTCSSVPADQQYGNVVNGQATGRNGITVWKANNVSIQNLTVCNFLSGSQESGNQIYWNGGSDSAKIGMKGYSGSYLSATSTYFGADGTAGTYGIFSSDAAGPASWNQIYGSNMNDAGMYVGACQQQCNVTISHAWMEYSALGYSGTNSGGAIVIKNSMFDNNKDGFDTNTQINGDPPAPQNGACPHNGISPITHTHSCWVVMNNTFADNNNPNVPQAGNAAQGPVGTGMTLSGGENDTVMNNTFTGNNAWGLLVIPYPDSSAPEYNQSCTGTGGVEVSGLGCVYDAKNNRVVGNHFSKNGSFGNVSNGDYGQIVLNANQPSNCYVNNIAPNGTAPANLEQLYPKCGVIQKTANTGGALFGQVLCDTGFSSCPAGSNYPQTTKVVMHPLPKNLPTLANPCSKVPSNAWCKNGQPI